MTGSNIQGFVDGVKPEQNALVGWAWGDNAPLLVRAFLSGHEIGSAIAAGWRGDLQRASAFILRIEPPLTPEVLLSPALVITAGETPIPIYGPYLQSVAQSGKLVR